MSRALILLLTIAFLETQLFSLAHAAEHSFGEQEQEECACEICLSVNYQNWTNLGTTSEICYSDHSRYVTWASSDVII